MRIAMVGHKRVPSREGGIEVVVEELAARMVMHGHSVTCYNRTGHHVSGKEYDIEHLDEYRGIRLKRVPTIDRKGLAAVTSSFFGCLAAAFGPYDVVHIHAEGPAMFSWLPRLTGKRVVLTVHGLDWARDKWKGSFGSWYIHTGEKTGVRFAHEIIVLNHSTQKYFQDTYGRATRYIPNGVNPVAVMRSRNVYVSIILQNVAALKALFEKEWESILGNCDEFLYLGGNETSTHKLISESYLGKSTIDTNTYGKSSGRNGNYSTNYQISGRELLTPDEVRMLDNRYALLFIRGERPVMDEKYDILKHPNIALTEDGGAAPYEHGGTENAIATLSFAGAAAETVPAPNAPLPDYELLSDEDIDALC